MQRIIAVGVAALLLVGCSQKAPLEDLSDGKCTGALTDAVNKHISGQIDALANKDWKAAYAFASKDFQAAVAIDQFTFIIGSQYAMLVENQGYEFDNCAIASQVIKQEVSVTSGEQVFNLTYRLSVTGNVLGVESAEVGKVNTQQNI